MSQREVYRRLLTDFDQRSWRHWRDAFYVGWPRGLSFALWLCLGMLPVFVVAVAATGLALVVLTAPLMAVAGLLGWGIGFWVPWFLVVAGATAIISALLIAPTLLGWTVIVAHEQRLRGEL